MLPRSDAVATLTGEPFDVLVIGGGITGAGVALDAATRGYSVALVERNDFASGTSSRSSKLVHGGLRYLQNFDLGLVSEALLERQINVNLAPHLVKPLKLIVPAFDGVRLDRVVGLGLNAYDVMSVDRIRRRRRRPDDDWSPARHRVIPGAEVSALLPALAARSPTSGYLFYDCQTDDSRLVLTVLAEAERFGAVAANRLEALELIEDSGRAGGARVQGHGNAATSSRSAPPTSSTPPACGPTGCAPPSCTTRPRCRSSGPAAAPTWSSSARSCRWTPARSSPPARAARSSSCRGSGRP